MVEKVLEKTGEPMKSHAMMYKMVVHAVLLYGRKRWVVAYAMMAFLEGFNQSANKQIAGMTVGKYDNREWEWASVDAALETTGIWQIIEQVKMRQVTMSEYVSGRPI